MEIEEIKEVDEDQEVEKYENNNGSSEYALNRLETEYADEDEQAYDLYSIEEIFINYIWNSVSWIFFLILSIFALNSMIPIFCPLFALVLLELKYLIQSLKVLREDYEIIESIYKSSHFIRTLDSIALLLSYGLIFCWFFNIVKLFSYSVVSVSVIEVLRVFFKVYSPNGCVTFAGIVHTSYRWVKLLVFINLCVKLDKFLFISWTVVIWPILGILIISFIISIVITCMCMINICSKTSDTYLLFSHLWLLYGLFCGQFTFIITYLHLTPQNPKVLLVPIFYLLFYIILTIRFKKDLTLAWWEFFVASNFSQNQFNSITQPLPLPGTQKEYIERSFKNKLANIIKKTPLSIVKLANPSHQTRTEKMQRKKNNRTLSQAIDVSVQKSMHLRSQSSNLAYDFSVLKPTCKLCKVNEGVNKFKECGHGELCSGCGEKYLKSKNQCYVCHEQITGIVNEYAKQIKGHSKRFSFSDL